MIIDTSAWVEFSRDASSPVRPVIRRVLIAGEAMTVDIVRLELLAGIPAGSQLPVRRTLARCTFVDQSALADVDAAADLFQRVRRNGETVRSPNDCLIAAMAIRVGVPILHLDRDFDTLARHTPLSAVRA